MSPEQILRDTNQQPLNFMNQIQANLGVKPEKKIIDFSSDMWSLGCIFAEMFVSLTPVFQAVDTFDRTIRFFEVKNLDFNKSIF